MKFTAIPADKMVLRAFEDWRLGCDFQTNWTLQLQSQLLNLSRQEVLQIRILTCSALCQVELLAHIFEIRLDLVKIFLLAFDHGIR